MDGDLIKFEEVNGGNELVSERIIRFNQKKLEVQLSELWSVDSRLWTITTLSDPNRTSSDYDFWLKIQSSQFDRVCGCRKPPRIRPPVSRD